MSGCGFRGGISLWACELLTLWGWTQMEEDQDQSLDLCGPERMMVLLRRDECGAV